MSEGYEPNSVKCESWTVDLTPETKFFRHIGIIYAQLENFTRNYKKNRFKN